MEIKVVAHEEFVVKVGSNALSLSRDEALKLYNELQTVLAIEIEIECEDVEITLDPVCPCPCIPYMPHSPWWSIDPHPYYHYDYCDYTTISCGTTTPTVTYTYEQITSGNNV